MVVLSDLSRYGYGHLMTGIFILIIRPRLEAPAGYRGNVIYTVSIDSSLTFRRIGRWTIIGLVSSLLYTMEYVHIPLWSSIQFRVAYGELTEISELSGGCNSDNLHVNYVQQSHKR
jgi:hypothetical protein